MTAFKLKPTVYACAFAIGITQVALAVEDTDTTDTVIETNPSLTFKQGAFILTVPYLEFKTNAGKTAYSAVLTSGDANNFSVDFSSLKEIDLRITTPEKTKADSTAETTTNSSNNDKSCETPTPTPTTNTDTKNKDTGLSDTDKNFLDIADAVPDNSKDSKDDGVGFTDADKEFLNINDSDSKSDSKNTPVDNKNDSNTNNTNNPEIPSTAVEIPSTIVGDDEPVAFIEVLKTHNVYRSAVGVPNIVWSNKVATSAQSWADTLQTKGCTLEHSGGQYGENIYWSRGFTPTMFDVTTSWGDERTDYDYATNSCSPGKICGHYTQIVWKNSQAVGCGKALCGDDTVVVCQYNPAGNFVGQKPY